MRNLRVVFTGGGTGGHVYPNISVYESLSKRSPGSEFLYIGTEKGEESRIVRNIQRPIRFKSIISRGLPQKLKSFSSLFSLLIMTIGTIKSIFLLKQFKPDIVIGSGGYVSAPVLFAAYLLKIKIFVHEQNAIPGRLNRFIGGFASKIAVSFRSTLKFFPEKKTIYSGYPLRELITLRDRNEMKERLDIPLNHKVIFVFGGSKGARTINTVFAKIIPELLKIPDLTVILSTGRTRTAEYKAYEETIRLMAGNGIKIENENNLIVNEYFENIDEIYSVTDLVVSRAGAGSIEEIITLGLPSILIPKIDLPGDHQIINAKEVEKSGSAKIVYEEITYRNGKKTIEIDPETLFTLLSELIGSDEELQNMRRSAARPSDSIKPADVISDSVLNLTDEIRESEKEEIISYYIHSLEDEKNYELIFSSTTFGNTLLSSSFIDIPGKKFLFEIKILGRDEKLFLRKIRGNILVNGVQAEKLTEISENNEIDVEGKKFILKKYTEIIEKFPENTKIQSKVIGSSLGIFVSRVGGFLREVIIAGLFGARNITDIYFAGLTISNLMRRIVAENALENAFLPIFMRLFRRAPREKLWKSTSSILNFSLLFSILISITGIVFAPAIVGVVYSGFASKGILAETVIITRIMFPYLVLVTIAAIFATILKAFNRFGIAELSSLFFSVGSIAGILALYSVSHIYALGIGVLFGGFLHAMFLYPFVRKILRDKSLQFRYYPVIKFSSPVNKKYYSQLIPISLDVFLSQTVSVIDQFLAAGLASGSISYLYYAKTIFRLPFAIISQAINSVVLRDFSDKIALFNLEKARRLFIDGVNINVFLLAPVSIIMFVLADPIVSILYARGKFVSVDIVNTSYVLQFYSLGLIGWGIHSLTTRIFSARIDIKKSMYFNFFMLIVNISLSFYLVNTSLKYAGLALATTISFILFSIIRVVYLGIQLSGEEMKISFPDLFVPLLKTLTASFFMIIVMIQSKMIFSMIDLGSSFLNNLLIFISLTFIGMSVYLISSLLLKNSEIFILKRRKRSSGDLPLPMTSPFEFFERISGAPEKYTDDYKYKINIYLNSNQWEVQNVGIKLIGLFRDDSKKSLLMKIISNRNANGFLRRNSVNSLRKIMSWDEECGRILTNALDDPYYEVRVSAIEALTEHIPESEYEKFTRIAIKKFEKANTEEKLAYIRLLSKAGHIEELDYLSRYFLCENSLIREEILKMVLVFFKKGIIDRIQVIKNTDRILVTSNNMKPHFRIKSILNEIYTEINKI